ncbi:MAG TPA: methenyltetrahydromethanopterin cyclohydrolase [Planctomycetaceae bacterium]|nr:methenyltetrahydromethanopterin cyclohydrolase [Planctomycetaceae bacterium]
MRYDLNVRAAQLVERVTNSCDDFRVRSFTVEEAQVLDFGVRTEGGLDAGQALAEICMAGLGWVSIQACDLLDLSWPHVFVTTDHPVAACLLSQYAGWQVTVDRFFAMGSGPMRAAYAREAVFNRLDYREQPGEVVGVLEGRKLPDASVVRYLCERTGVTSDRLRLLVAPTASQAGNVQVAARSIETALHKLFELGFDVSQVKSGCGNAPLPPVAADDMAAIGRTNDAILYGARVTLWVRADDEALTALGPKVPANSSPAFGKPFAQIFEQAGRDFYKIDPQLFSPAEITFCNLDTGKVQRFGKIQPEIVRTSFGL